MPVPFNDAPLPEDKTCPHFPCPHPFGLGSEDHIFLWGKKETAFSLHPTTGALLCVNYLRKGEWLRCNHLCLLTHPGCSDTPHT